MKVTLTLVVLFILPFAENQVYLYYTEDSSLAEFYDCIDHQGLLYCRRPPDPVVLKRDNTTWHCYHNGIVHSFASLRSNNINVSTVLHKWKSSIEKAEEYSRYTRHATDFNGYLCQCKNQHSFGKNCEYLLPMGSSFEQTLIWEVQMREQHMWQVQMHGDIVCYTTLACGYGLLCLDWRDMCDGVQQCMSGLDEENCDMLEFNECEDHEYRCINGMCVPDEYFLDGDYDCMDWTDEKEIIYDEYCPFEQVSSTCDDRMCTSKLWSCGDGQCIFDRLGFQKPPPKSVQCYSRRDSYHMCETDYVDRLWTLPNGRCYEADIYEELSVHNSSHNQDCVYLVKCTLSRGAEKHCPCGRPNISCNDRLDRICSDRPIMYPNRGTIAPYVFAFYDRSHEWNRYEPDFIELHGTIKCRESIVRINATRWYQSEFNLREIEAWICKNPPGTLVLNSNGYDQYCHNGSRTFTHHFYHSVDVCNISRECISAYRVRDGIRNCVDRMDETQSKIVSDTCSNVKQHRFRCSVDEPTCLGVGNLGNLISNCKNNYDESWMGTSRMFIKMNCNHQSKDDCQAIRQYIEVSWTSNFTNNFSLPIGSVRISYRTYCDTFWNLGSKMDENVTMCQRWWVCPRDQWQCRTGQCINAEWVLDGEWDCSDASDEEALMVLDATLLNRNLQVVPSRVLEERFNSLHRLQLVSNVCNISTELSCIRTNFYDPIANITQNRPCIRLEQIGDGHIDCYGGIDERNIIQYCTQLTMLGYNFKCSSTKSCVAYGALCHQRCSSKSDDALWCDSRQNSSYCSTSPKDFLCFNGTCLINGRCNGISECIYAEDEYMCDPRKGSGSSRYREHKEFIVINTKQKLYLFQFPNDTNTTESTDTSDPIVQNQTSEAIISPDLLSTSTPYQCNRGIGVQIHNDSTACFCPPQYYGDKCEFHNDRVTVILHMDFSQSDYSEESDITMVLKMLVLFLFRNQTLATREFHVRPAVEIKVYNKKIAHFLYSRSSELLRHKKARYLNRSDILNEHPYSIRIEAYERQTDEKSLLFAVWQYPVYFDYLPVFRLAKVLRLPKTVRDRNPCLSRPCHENQECQQLVNHKSKYICLCKANYTGENCSILDQKCANGYCSPKALCKPNYRGLSTETNQPYCICPANQYGQRCEIMHDGCTSNPCRNGDSCFPTSNLDRVICLSTDQYLGKNDELKKPSVKLYINKNVKHAGAVVQYFDINFSTLDLIFIHQQAFSTLPTVLQYWQDDKTAPFIILVKLYRSYSDVHSHIHLISVHINVTSIYGTAQITEQNHCVQVSTLFQSNDEISHFKYHRLCRDHQHLFCFYDDSYLCVCENDHNRAECFGYDHSLDQCSKCHGGSRCLQGHRSRSNDFICLCSPCRSGRTCLFNAELFAFTLDQLFFTDLTSNTVTFYFLIIGPLIMLFVGLLNNLCSYVTFRRRKCLRSGIGQYLLYMSVINEINLGVLAARLIHLALSVTSLRSHSTFDKVLCKLLSYLLSCSSRIPYYLSSLVSMERVYITLCLNGRWLKKPHIARRLIVFTIAGIFSTGVYELAFVSSQSYIGNGKEVICVVEFPTSTRSIWMLIHQIISITHSILPLLINICCTITISCVVTKKKMKICVPNTDGKTKQPTSVNLRNRLRLVCEVLRENKELVIGPGITLVPQLFSLPLFAVSFTLGCHSLESSRLRYLLIASYFTSFIPQLISFFLYVLPSSFYSKEWHATAIGGWTSRLMHRRQEVSSPKMLVLSSVDEEDKTKR